MSFSIRIGAEDTGTAGVFRGVLSNVMRLARTAAKPITIPLQIGRGGLGILRDINLGLAPVIRGIDNVIDRGSKLEVIQRGFRSLTGAGAKDAARMAQDLVKASSGTLKMAEAMALANRALGSMSMDDLMTAVEFVSKKSVATGKEAGEALNTVITGLVRGSTLFLDDFGILVDGSEGVKRTFDAIKGAGAFDQLGPAAQKAETIRQAIVEMRQQTDKLGVSGKETFFLWSGLRNLIGDGVDKLVLAVAKSDALKSALKGAADILRGVTAHFEGGGSFTELFFGKGQSGGIFGVLKAGLLDAGEALGRGILGGLLKGLSALPEIFKFAWDGIKGLFTWFVAEIPPAIRTGLEWLKTEFLPAWEATLKPLTDALGNFIFNLVSAVEKKFKTYTHDPEGRVTTIGRMLGMQDEPKTVMLPGEHPISYLVRKMGLSSVMKASGIVGESPDATAIRARQIAFANSTRGDNIAVQALKGIPHGLGEAINGLGMAVNAVRDYFTGETERRKQQDEKHKESLQSRADSTRASGTLAGFFAQMGVTTALAQMASSPNLWELFSRSGDKLLAGGVLGGNLRVKDELVKVHDDFRAPFERARKPRVDVTGLALTERGRNDRIAIVGRAEREIQQEQVLIRREARRLAGQEERRLRREGFVVTGGDRRRIEEALFQDLLQRNQRVARARRNIDDAAIDIDADVKRRAPAEQQRVRDAMRDKFLSSVDATVRELKGIAEGAQELLEQVLSVGNGLLTALGSGEAQIAGAGGRRA